MTLDQIDRALAEWNAKIAAASANLLDLDDLDAYRRLRGSDGLSPLKLSGVSAAQVTPAVEAVRLLWNYLQLLTNVFNEAAELRKSVRPWNTDNLVRRIDSLLHGPSIVLSTVQTPLARRALLTDAAETETTTPDHLLAVMTQAFELAKDTFLAVESAWNRLEPALTETETAIATLRQRAAALGESDVPELQNIHQRVNGLRLAIASDPLGVHASFSQEIEPVVNRIRTRLDALKAEYDHVQADMERARGLLGELEGTNRRAAIAEEECRREILKPTGLQSVIPERDIADLRIWLETLQNNLAGGHWKPARIGLDRWLQSGRVLAAQSQEALTANTTLLEARAELRGRLSSLQAKARAYRTRGTVIDPQLDEVARRAEELLHRRPTPIEAAAEGVQEYERLLNSALRK